MEGSKEENLYLAVEGEDQESLQHLLLRGADPNKVTSKGKTCLGEAARLGNIDIIKPLLEVTYSNTQAQSQNICKPKKTYKRKLKQDTVPMDTMPKYKYSLERSVSDCYYVSCEEVKAKEINPKEMNQGYFVFIHNEGSSSDDSKVSTVNSSVSSASLTPTSQGDLEWDEEITAVAPTTKDDETWCSLYKWYASILESTGAALASATSMSNGIDQQDSYTHTAIHYAAENGHLGAVKLLIEAGCKVDVLTSDGLTPLHVAVIRNHLEVTKTLLASGCHVNYKTHEKMTPLHFAASRGLLEMVKTLVSSGACIEARDTNERTPLYLAAGRGHSEVVKYLISAGSNVNGEEIHGYTPLCEAVWQRSVNVVEVLLQCGARVTHSHKLLHNAVLQKQDDIVSKLVSVAGGLNLCNESGDTPLLLATKMSHVNCVDILLKAGANVNACNSITGANALHVAVESVEDPTVFEELFNLLLQYKIDMNATAIMGDAALCRALILQKDYAAKLLIRNGADVNSFDFYSCGLDNLTIASCRRSPSLAEMLIKAGHYTHIPEPFSSPEKLGLTTKYVHELSRTPLSLRDLSRIRIRMACRNDNLIINISSLPLPVFLKKFLTMEIV